MLMRLKERKEIKKILLFSPIYLAMAAWCLFGCATAPTTKPVAEETKPAGIQAITVTPSAKGGTVVDIKTSKSTLFTALKLIDPPRVVIDILGNPGTNLSPITPVNDGNVTVIRVEENQPRAGNTRLVIGLARALEYKMSKKDKTIRLNLQPKSPEVKPAQTAESSEKKETAKEAAETKPYEPRIFFKPRSIPSTQILGVDFTMMDKGKSSLTITTNKKTRYDLKRKDVKTLILTLQDITIPPLLLRRLDSTHFEGAVDRVKSNYTPQDKKLVMAIFLREMVPFHIDQSEKGIKLDFGATSVKPPQVKIVTLKVEENEKVVAKAAQPKEEKKEKAIKETVVKPSPEPTPPKKPVSAAEPVPPVKPVKSQITLPGLQKKAYTGAPMTMDFVNADVTNILRLIGEISNLNIIWGPDVKGTVSMRLKNVPWDQALDLVLANNDLGMRRAGNVIWVTTGSRIKQIEAEEKRKREEAQAAIEAERERKKKEMEEAQELEPLVTEYLSLDFASADEIKTHVDPLLTDRGSTSVDERTNTIIIKDVASIIKEAKEIVQRFDTPVKQIMIEARIVDATSNFTRDLGVQWRSLDGTRPGFSRFWQHREGAGFGLDPTTFGQDQDLTFGSEFSTNSPENWAANIGLSFARLTNRGLGTLALDASLALAESEGTAKVISAPKVIAREGTAATISRGDQIIIPATENVASTTLDATLSLTVTPTKVSFNDYITLDVKVTDDQAPTTSRILKKSINTTLMFKSGETVVIGGIYKETKGEDVTGVPWLKDVPFFGWLFKAQRRTTERSELLIFLTPKVLPPETKL